MADWIPISVDSLYEASVAALIDACSKAAKATGQPDRAPGLIQGRITHIRRKIASNRANTLATDPTTIPESLRDMAVDMIIARLKKALGIALTEDEVDALRTHEKDLNRIADGTDVVDAPDSPVVADVQGGGGIDTIEEGNSGSSREDMRGL